MIKLNSSNDKKAVFECGTRGETFQKMHCFFKDRKFCDVVLIAGNDNTKVSAHRIVLSASSEYFLKLLEKSPISEITLEQVDGEILHVLVNFIYTATLEIRGELIDNIMRTASLLKLDAVITECCDYLAGKLSNVNCLPVAVFSEQHNYPDLYEKSFMYASQHFTELFKEESFLELDSGKLCQLIRRNDLCVNSEEDVFRGIMAWIQHDRPNQDKPIDELLSHLRFALIKPEFIASEIEEVCQSPESQALIIKAFKWHMLPASRSAFPAEYSTPRNLKREIFLIKGGTEMERDLFVEVFDPFVSEWTLKKWPNKPKLGWYTSGILINGKMYLAGTTVHSEDSCVHCFDITAQCWTELPPMSSNRYAFGMVELNGQLYAVGGNNGTNCLCTVEKWDPSSPLKWQEVTPMRSARPQPGVAVLNGLLYAIGSTSDFEHNTFEFYDPQTNTWAELTPPGQPRTSVGLTVVNGLLYAVGGRTVGGICTMLERYDPKTDFWTEISPSGKFQQYHQCVTSLDRLIVLVEVNEGRTIHILEEYNPETGKWRTLNPLQRYHGNVILISK